MSFSIGQVKIGLNEPFFVIAGPCVLTDEHEAVCIAKRLSMMQMRTGIPIVFKASFDKANRSHPRSFRGPGMYPGLNMLKAVREKTGLPVITDVHETHQAEIASRFVDALQVPAFLCRQTDLIVACAKTGLPVNVKKGQFLSPEEMMNVKNKIGFGKSDKILFTERGNSFGYGRLVNDMTGISTMQRMGVPVVFDATHSVRISDTAKCGLQFTETERFALQSHRKTNILAKSATAAGANGLYLEVHPNPAKSKCDSDCIHPLDNLEDLVLKCHKIFQLIREMEVGTA